MAVATGVAVPDPGGFSDLLDPRDRTFAARLFEHAVLEGRAESPTEALSLVIGRAWSEYRRAIRRQDWQSAHCCRRISELVVQHAASAEAYAAGLIECRSGKGGPA